MKSILAYADKQSLFPGEEIEFKVSTENINEYDLKIVRLKEPSVGEGDDYPEYNPIEMETDLPKKMKGRKQETPFGSYAILEKESLFTNISENGIFGFNTYIFPTLIKKENSTIFQFSNKDGKKNYKFSINEKGFELSNRDSDDI